MSIFLSSVALLSVGEADAQPVDVAFSGSLRYRLASIQDDGFTEDALASTYQLLLKAELTTDTGFGAVVEGRHVGHLGSDDFNDTLNGQTQFPVEADPEATEFAQAYFTFTTEQVSAWAGRRKVSWGNQRFVSALGWRQNERSFDGVGFQAQPLDQVTVRYQYAFNVNRPQSEDSPVGNFEGDFHFLDAQIQLGENNALNVYAFDHDFSSTFAQGLSARTVGANWTVSRSLTEDLTGHLIAELAHQSDSGSNPASFDHSYYRAEGQVRGDGWSVKAGRETLAGDGTTSFRTPFALLHGYNGFADRFLATPANGLTDTYVGATANFGPVRAGITYHDFTSDNGSIDYGTEWDAVATVPVNDRVSVQVKVADYEANLFSRDTTKAWLTIRATF